MTDKHVTLTRLDGSLLVKPWVSAIEEELTCRRKRSEVVKGKLHIQYDRIPLFVVDNGFGITYPGLFRRTYAALQRLGFFIEVDDLQKELIEPDISLIEGDLREGQPDVLISVMASRRGVVVSPCGTGKTFLIEQLCRVYAGRNILVVTPRSGVLKDIYRRVKESCPYLSIGMVRAGKAPKPENTVLICSAKSLHKIDTDWPYMMFFDEVHGSAAPETGRELTRFSGCRMYGFTASPKGRGDRAELLIEALFGEIICEIGYEEAAAAGTVVPIQVYMIPVQCPEQKYTFPVARERHNIWHNRTRNTAIASIARRFDKDEQVLILVNVAEHAFILKQFLPDYTVVTAGIPKEKRALFLKKGILSEDVSWNEDPDACREAFRRGELSKVIATGVWREGVDFPDLRVLIRADGSSGNIPAIQIGGRISRIAQQKEEAILIDFLDDFGAAYLKRSQERMKHYKAQKWEISKGILENEA